MGLEDRDYMRDRARERAESRGAVFKKSSQRPEKKRANPLLLIIIMSTTTTALITSNHRARTADPVPEPTTQAEAPSEPAQPLTIVNVPVRSQPAPIPVVQQPAIELAYVLGGTRTQDLNHINAVTPDGAAVTPDAFPANATIEWFVPFNADLQLGKLTIFDNVGDRTNKIVRLRQPETGIVVAQAYIRPGEGVYLMLPIGHYVMTLAMGTEWHGKPAYFGPGGSYLNTNQLVQVIPGEMERDLLPSSPTGTMTPLPTQQF